MEPPDDKERVLEQRVLDTIGKLKKARSAARAADEEKTMKGSENK